MKKNLSRLLALVLAISMCLAMTTTVSAASIPDPGNIDLSLRITQQADGTYKAAYVAQMVMIEEIAKVATIYRSHELMDDLRFVCTLDDSIIRRHVIGSEESFSFESAKWKGVSDIFLFEKAEIVDTGLKMTYKLNPTVIYDWFNAKTIDVKNALMQPMAMFATLNITAEQAELVQSDFVTTGKVEIKGAGINKYYGNYSILAAIGQLVSTEGGEIGGLDDCPRNQICPAWPFTDLDLQLWYHDGIHYCVEHGLMEGFPNNLFMPHGDTTRAQIVTILYRLEGKPAVNGTQVFDDVTLGKWYTEAIEWANACGVVEGYGNGEFKPDTPISREQMAAILYRYANTKGYDVSAKADLSSFTDASTISTWAVDAMMWANASGLINGMGDGTLNPLGNTERCQAAALLQRFCMNIVK